jgi:predicted acylesterase/phospholipase RssA
MNELNKKPDSCRRNKLGLALAGGGFRASLFHLGVLRRMAELDLLRSVEVLSTVSGGSIIGGLYMLLLKRKFQQPGPLERKHYIEIIDELDTILVKGIQKNLRTRLFMNPLGILRVLTTTHSLGKRMSRIYERYLYREIADELEPKTLWDRFWRPGKIGMRTTLISPKAGGVPSGLERYNREAVSNNRPVITNLILNATSLNSGVPFRFSNIEVGDGRLGFFRYDELHILLEFKKLLFSTSMQLLERSLRDTASSSTLTIGNGAYERRRVSLVYWWRRYRIDPAYAASAPPEWKELYDALPGFPGRMLDAEFGLLRQLKLPAWYLRKGPSWEPPVDGGLTPPEQEGLFWEGFSALYQDEAENLERLVKSSKLFDQLLDFVLELYYVRSAEVMSRHIKKQWENLTLGEAVGASACFPPVFPPYITFDFYDDWHVSRLGLTDGGVYDNMGLTTLLEERCNYIIASDTGGLFDSVQQSSTGRIGMSGRIIGILMDDVSNNQRELARVRRRTAQRIEALCASTPAGSGVKCDDLSGLAYFHINSPAIKMPGLDLGLDPNLLAALRTDLDGFGDVEIAALVNHGYDTADRYLRTYLAQSPYQNAAYWTKPEREPKPIYRSRKDVEHILRVGKSRFFRALQLHAPLTILFSLLAVALCAAATWKRRTSVEGLVGCLADQSLQWIRSSASFLGTKWTAYSFSIGACMALAAVAAIGIMTFKTALGRLIEPIKNTYLPWYSRISTVYKWARSLSKNIIWAFRVLPVLFALGAAGLAWLSHVFFFLPFKRRTNNSSHGEGKAENG